MRRWIEWARQYARDARLDEISGYAAHASFFIILAAFPALVLMLGLLRHTSLEPADLMDLIGTLVPDALHGMLWDVIHQVYSNTSRTVVSFSALTALWSAGRGIYALQKGLNGVCGTRDERGWLRTRLMCAAYTFLFLLVLLLTLVLHVFGSTVVEFLSSTGKPLPARNLSALRFFLLVGVQTLLFGAMFMYLPGKRSGLRESLPGALLGSLGWMTASGAFSWYVEHFSRFASIYGSVYAVAVGMLWLYVCVSIVFYGAVLNRLLAHFPK